MSIFIDYLKLIFGNYPENGFGICIPICLNNIVSDYMGYYKIVSKLYHDEFNSFRVDGLCQSEDESWSSVYGLQTRRRINDPRMRWCCRRLARHLAE